MVVFSSLPGGSLGLGAADLGTVLAALALRMRHTQQVTATSTAGAAEGCQTLSVKGPQKGLTDCCATGCDDVGTRVMKWAPGRALCAARSRESP